MRRLRPNLPKVGLMGDGGKLTLRWSLLIKHRNPWCWNGSGWPSVGVATDRWGLVDVTVYPQQEA
ncbi:MAG: hypothetical protein KBG15_00315 [Kofleriaceae bacterium]|nr:hypothetical protein [Kofleriaceae bacterium]